MLGLLTLMTPILVMLVPLFLYYTPHFRSGVHGGQITFYNLERYVLVSTVSLKTNKNRVAGRQPLATININIEVIKCSTFIPLLLFIVHTDSESALSFYNAPAHPPSPMNLIVI